MKNPCLYNDANDGDPCDLLHEDKNNPTCMNCKPRIKYVASIGGMTHSPPLHMSDLDSGPGGDGKAIEVDTMAEKDQISNPEEFIEAFCNQFDIDMELLLGKTGISNRQNIVLLRRQLAKGLRDFGLSNSRIAEAMGRSLASIGGMLAKGDSAFGHAARYKTDAGKAVEEPKTPSAAQPAPPADELLALEALFLDHDALFDKVGEIAKDELRSLENQVLWFIKDGVRRHKEANR